MQESLGPPLGKELFNVLKMCRPRDDLVCLNGRLRRRLGLRDSDELLLHQRRLRDRILWRRRSNSTDRTWQMLDWPLFLGLNLGQDMALDWLYLWFCFVPKLLRPPCYVGLACEHVYVMTA